MRFCKAAILAAGLAVGCVVFSAPALAGYADKPVKYPVMHSAKIHHVHKPHVTKPPHVVKHHVPKIVHHHVKHFPKIKPPVVVKPPVVPKPPVLAKPPIPVTPPVVPKVPTVVVVRPPAPVAPPPTVPFPPGSTPVPPPSTPSPTPPPKHHKHRHHHSHGDGGAAYYWAAGFAGCIIAGNLIDMYRTGEIERRKRTREDQDAVFANCLLPFIGGLIVHEHWKGKKPVPLLDVIDTRHDVGDARYAPIASPRVKPSAIRVRG